MALTNSKRLLFAASHVAIDISHENQNVEGDQPQAALRNLSVVRAVDLRSDELPALRKRLQSVREPRVRADLERVLHVAEHLAANPASHLDSAAALAPVASDLLVRFARFVRPDARAPELTMLLEAVHLQEKIAPVGRLHLERIEMYPVGVEKGEMVFTVPMAPAETVTVSHKEWSTSSQEYEQIVQDSFESYSERGVAEKTDASMSTENEAKHANELSFGATLSGSYGPVSLTTTLGLKATSEDRQAAKQSMQRTQEVTQKASARARQEHKVSIKLETKKGVEDSSFRTISNPSTTNAIRIDYYRMMRKWKTDLYRYGLRMTYDVTLPTPGVRLWARWQRLAALDRELQTPFPFTLRPEELTGLRWSDEAIKVGAKPMPPPQPEIRESRAETIDYIPEDQSGITRYGKLEFDVPAGYVLKSCEARATISHWTTHHFKWLNGKTLPPRVDEVGREIVVGQLHDLDHRTGHLAAQYHFNGVSFAGLWLDLTYEPSPETMRSWRIAAWESIRAAAQARYQEHVARLQEERDRLYRQLAGKDTLSLRRLEREEMLRLIMLWLFGPSVGGLGTGFSNAPRSLQATIDKLLSNEQRYMEVDPTLQAADSPTFTGVARDPDWSSARAFGELVKFIHQAVEWENLLYSLYPYFWGSENQGRAKLLFEHLDPEHERFLRAGYVRVAITIRPGFEEAFVQLVETGSLAGVYKSRWLTVAQDVANFARTNYANIPPANPEKHARPLLYPQQRRTWELMQPVIDQIEQYHTDNGTYPKTLADLGPAVPVDAWGHNLIYNFPGSGNDYDLISYGASGEEGGDGLDADISSAAGASLVGTWFDYTPTSGIDIEVDTKPEDIA